MSRGALVEFLGDLVGEVVVGVLAFPKSVVETEDVFQRAVGRDALFAAGIEVVELLDEQKVTRSGVGVNEGADGAADGGLLGAAAKSDDLVHLGAVGVDGAEIGHGGSVEKRVLS